MDSFVMKDFARDLFIKMTMSSPHTLYLLVLCTMKDHMTDDKIKAYFERVDQCIKEHGYNLTNVFASNDSPSFCYSTGIYKSFKIPDVFISSLPPGLWTLCTWHELKKSLHRINKLYFEDKTELEETFAKSLLTVE